MLIVSLLLISVTLAAAGTRGRVYKWHPYTGDSYVFENLFYFVLTIYGSYGSMCE
jgi:hypothetical protein